MIRLTPVLSNLNRVLPAPLVSAHFALGLEVARYLKWLQPPAEIEGKRFAIKIEDLQLRSCFTCRQGRFRPLWASEADLELGAALGDFVALMRGATDADTLFFQRRLRISGDTELGLIVKNWLDATERPGWLRRAGKTA
ncbi:ubiquinone anaerobic biosynthesis accessory factor UbiT [Bordetella petrii]|uniref:ubiquinone anaerobic biosynthesis accessory factor UbiT n=1 Tax=Bordetella petrii TaxID=94624 RepID=UPI001E547ABE|nr:SCP2 sterol-binding domain-containing protein [Bordetella petrii]MCD0502041.1 SCP2 sterol-binding domain-containing protein [Bordetella petrii]